MTHSSLRIGSSRLKHCSKCGSLEVKWKSWNVIQILGLPFTLQDLETMDPDVHNSLRWMLNNDITDTGVDEQYFVVNWEGLGVNHEHLLCPAGDQMRLSEENKGEYVSNYLRWRFTRGTGEQYDSFIAGLTEVVPIPMLQKRFDNRELELVISGLGKVLLIFSLYPFTPESSRWPKSERWLIAMRVMTHRFVHALFLYFFFWD